MLNMNLKKVLDALGKYKYLLLVVAVGIILLLLPTGSPDKQPAGDGDSGVPAAVYPVEEFERRLEKAISSMSGVGRVQVLCTLKTDMELKLQEDRRENQSRQYDNAQLKQYAIDSESTTILLSESGGTESPLVVKRIYPEFQGAFVVCDGADSMEVKLKIVEAVAGLTGLGADKITVVKMKEQ